MANPNIVDVQSILGKTATQVVGNSYAPIVTCPADTLVKINSLYITSVNVDDFNGAISVRVNKGTGSDVRIADEIIVPAASSLVLISRDSLLYLEEGDSLELLANDLNYLEAVCSYEEITA